MQARARAAPVLHQRALEAFAAGAQRQVGRCRIRGRGGRLRQGVHCATMRLTRCFPPGMQERQRREDVVARDLRYARQVDRQHRLLRLGPGVRYDG
jgi:hypothetical protein